MSGHRSLVAPAVISVIALIAAACAPDDEEAAPEEFSPGPLGAVTVAPDDPIMIGVIQAISGDTASLGVDQVRAIDLAIADRGGELLGHPVETQVEDDACLAEGGTTAAQALVANPQVMGVLGTSCSGAAVPAMEILAETGIATISGSNTSPALTSDLEGTQGAANQPGYFRTSHNDVVQGQAAAEFAFTELGAQRAATIHDGDPYTEGLATAFGTSFTELGGEVVLATAISKGDTDMRPVLTEVAAATPDIVFFPIFQPEADFIVQQAKDFPALAETQKMMGADGLLSDTFVVIPQTEGMYFSGPATPTGSAYEDFVAAYQAEFGEAPIQAFHAHSYDAANMLMDAVEEVAVEEDDGTLQIDRQALMDQLYATEDFEGLTGTLTCDEFGDCADPKIDIVQNTAEQQTIDQVRGNVLFTFEPGE
ncbi:ABC transporter substrate-binding protein [Jiangella aurantiaca]|uniref:ABC transporter substrate-binding protein n=1 Tax=Jiangella aurantiaca TaxID=2530373 RepID=A0A4R5A702_9ACTN|nr:branched-chain amino acid ABC transporter substrate-binding protein [Jiangella aurantiaca]TDD67883.1 ABC transporter substrate-binding protein [Jiangella aurantiaca]